MNRAIVLRNGMPLPILGIGTWEMGGRETPDLSHRNTHITAIRTAIENGLTHIDTASMYGDGEAERITGEAITAFQRHHLFITTKVWPTHLHRARLRQSAFDSLKRLGIDYVDSLLIHAPNPDVAIEETMEELCRLKLLGITRSIGVSNFSFDQLRHTEQLFPGEISVCQNEYSLQSIDDGLYTKGSHTEVIPFCRHHGIAFVGWRPLGKGRLLQHASPVLTALAAKYNCSAAQIALAWAVYQPGTATIVKASNPAHILENSAATSICLSAGDYKQLTNHYAR